MPGLSLRAHSGSLVSWNWHARLYDLQNIDSEHDKLTMALEGGDALADIEKRLIQCQQEAAVCEQSLSKAREQAKRRKKGATRPSEPRVTADQIHRLEAEIRALEKRIDDYDSSQIQRLLAHLKRLIPGRAYPDRAAVKKRVAALKRWLAVLRKQTEATVSVQEARQLLQNARGSLRAAERWLKRVRDQSSELAVLEERRDQLGASIGSAVLSQYEQLRGRYGNRVVVRVQRGKCEGCRASLSASVVESAGVSDWLTLCPSCGRFLYGSIPNRTSVGTNGLIEDERLSWEVLPEGWWRDPSFVSRLRSEAAWSRIRLDMGRLKQLATLSPKKTYEGRYMGRRQYIVFEFDRVCFAECWITGNALYYTTDPGWRTVFAETKREALRMGAKRIFHRGDWFARAAALVSGQA